MIKKTLAVASLALLAAFAVAPAAHAATYVPGTPAATVTGSATAGGVSTVAFGDGAYANNENVAFTLSGVGTATLTVVKAATAPITKVSNGAGAVSIKVALPAEASGSYVLTGRSATAVNTATITVAAADSATGKSLASTGFDAPMLLIWAAAGVLVLGVALVLVRNTVRRHRTGE